MNKEKDTIYYDNDCYICSLEINAIKNRGESCGIQFIDISDEKFDAKGKDYNTEMIGEFSGEETVGMETFRRLYEKMGFKKSVALSRLPIIRNFFNCGYYIFANCIRPYLPKRGKK
tara:strand:- start:445 stop:792 length:348 start_codon:yes stop_codon:yes gene_type:complete